MLRRTLCRLGFAILAAGVTTILLPAQGHAGGGGRETIKVNKCEYAVTVGSHGSGCAGLEVLVAVAR